MFIKKVSRIWGHKTNLHGNTRDVTVLDRAYSFQTAVYHESKSESIPRTFFENLYHSRQHYFR